VGKCVFYHNHVLPGQYIPAVLVGGEPSRYVASSGLFLYLTLRNYC
jgi:hypothetical protein